ncbi:MAG: class I SAM-dependent methyltransferase [Clostridiales bacterium]|jgi:tRNA (adenine22-N1)-methyltransferase|nr:class I SAM-dependent methyltransferase [Clostridiales bacterium]
MISKRLQVIADLVQPQGVVVDVGCDHGYLCEYLLDRYANLHCIACDISQACLDKVRDRDRLSKRLGDGLDVLNVTEKVHTIVIAGLGGNLMSNMLDRYLARLSQQISQYSIQLVLSPQSDQHKVRQLLAMYNCEFVEDFVLLDGGKFYDIIKVVYNSCYDLGPSNDNKLTQLQLQFGVYYQVRNRALARKLRRELVVYSQAILNATDVSVLQSKIDNIREVLVWQQ